MKALLACWLIAIAMTVWAARLHSRPAAAIITVFRQRVSWAEGVMKRNFDAKKIFVHASHFHESDHRLRNTVPKDRPDQVMVIGHPAMVLSALASELYLKCLLCAEGKPVPSTHNLRDLYKRLDQSTRRRLEDLWDEDIRRSEKQQVLDKIRTLPGGEKFRPDLPYHLNISANAFIELRYIYETGRAFFLLSDLPNLLRKVILEKLPSWG